MASNTNILSTERARLLTSTVGSAEQPVYFSNGQALSTTYYLKASVDESKVDHLAAYSTARTIGGPKITSFGRIDSTTVTPGYTGGGEQFYKAVLKNFKNWSSRSNEIWIGSLVPNSEGPAYGQIYNNIDIGGANDLPKYSTFLFHNLNGSLESFGTVNYAYYYRKYVYESDTAWNIKATKDGSGNTITSYYCTLSTTQTLSGAKTFSSQLTVNNQARISSTSSYGMLQLYPSSGTESSIGYHTNASTRKWTVGAGTGAIGMDKFGWYYGASGNKMILTSDGTLTATKVYNAVWNDLAEYRKTEVKEPGRAITQDGHLTERRLISGARIISDTYGMCMGVMEEDKSLQPVGLCGRVLAYPYEPREKYKIGDVVCSGPNGTISRMSKQEIRNYPHCIIGVVNEIPDYEIWKPTKDSENPVQVDGRIWIDIK